MAKIDIPVNPLVFNEITESALKEMEAAGTVPSNELFFTSDDKENKAVVFAESERQKSKNLLNASCPEETSYSMTYHADTSKLYISGTYTDGARCFFGTWNLKKGTYTLCLRFVSGSMTRFSEIVFHLYRGTSWDRYVDPPRMSATNTQVYATFTLDTDVNDATLMLYQNHSDNTMTDCVFEYQIVSGSTPDFDFQPYNGEIVHENQLINKTNMYTTNANDTNVISIQHSSLTTLREYFDLFKKDMTKIYQCYVGALSDANFQKLVGTPTGGGNYTLALIKLIAFGDGDTEKMTTFEVMAIDPYVTCVTKGYIYANRDNTVVFTGWIV